MTTRAQTSAEASGRRFKAARAAIEALPSERRWLAVRYCYASLDREHIANEGFEPSRRHAREAIEVVLEAMGGSMWLPTPAAIRESDEWATASKAIDSVGDPLRRVGLGLVVAEEQVEGEQLKAVRGQSLRLLLNASSMLAEIDASKRRAK